MFSYNKIRHHSYMFYRQHFYTFHFNSEDNFRTQSFPGLHSDLGSQPTANFYIVTCHFYKIFDKVEIFTL